MRNLHHLSLSTKNSPETMNESQIIHPHYELPELFQSRNGFNEMARWYSTIDTCFRSWRKFTKEDFESALGFRNFTFKSWGYHSLDHLFIMRGCVPDGDYYTYDIRTATERKLRILAAHLRKFSCAEFCDKYKKVFATEVILMKGCGFDSVKSLLDSIPELMSIGVHQYEVRRGADLLAWPKIGKGKEVRTRDEGIDGTISVDSMAKSHYEKLDQPQGFKRRSSAFKSPEESQGEPAPKRSKHVESSAVQDSPPSFIGRAEEQEKSAETQSAQDGAKKKKLKNKAKREGKVKASETTRSDCEITKSALKSVKKKKVSNKSGKRKKAARCESASTVCSQGNIEATGGMSEGESGEVVQKKLKKAKQKLKEVERKLKEAETKLRRKKSLKSKRVRVKEEVMDYVESADGSPSNTSLPNDYVPPVAPMVSGFHPIPMPTFPSFETDTAVNNSWSPSVAPPMNVQNTNGTPTPKMESGSWTNSTEGAHQLMWTNGQMQPMMALPGFTPVPVVEAVVG